MQHPHYQSRRGSRLAAFAAALTLATVACGYRAQGPVRSIPGGIASIGVPTFRNSTQQFKVEQQITRAVLSELAARTRARVTPRASGVDAVLQGEIRGVSSTPVAFGSDTFGSTFLVTVQVAVRLVRSSDDTVLWENPDYVFRERYVLASSVVQFFSEESPALDRLAKELAGSLVGTLLAR